MGFARMAPDEPIREDELEEVVPLLELAQSMGSLDRAGMTRIGRAWVEGLRLAARVENQEYTAGLARLPREPGAGRWEILEQVARLATERVPAMCFLDLAGYTRLTEERGDQAAAGLAGTLAELVGRAAREHGRVPVKWLGDGVMVHFREPAAAVQAALQMVERLPAAGLPPADVGVAEAGEVQLKGFARPVRLLVASRR